MTDFSDFTAQIADWANRQDWSSTLVTGFVRMAEQKLNSELRVDRMINFSQNTISCRCAPLPDDWLEMDLVQIQDPNAPTGFSPIKYKPRHEFFSQQDTINGYTPRNYTIEGREVYFSGPPDAIEGTTFTIAYYGEVPVFSDTVDSWVYTKYPNLYLFAALMHADLHAIGEEQSAGNLKGLAEDMITKLNADHQRARASGSRLSRSRVRSFG
jgi:hypothetical protein